MKLKLKLKKRVGKKKITRLESAGKGKGRARRCIVLIIVAAAVNCLLMSSTHSTATTRQQNYFSKELFFKEKLLLNNINKLVNFLTYTTGQATSCWSRGNYVIIATSALEYSLAVHCVTVMWFRLSLLQQQLIWTRNSCKEMKVYELLLLLLFNFIIIFFVLYVYQV